MRKRPLRERLFDGTIYGLSIFAIVFSIAVLAYFYFTLQEFYGYPIILYSLLFIMGIIGLRLYKRHK